MYTCPACNEEFEKVIDSQCPHCQTKLEQKRGRKDRKLYYYYAIAADATNVPTGNEPPEVALEEGQLISEPGEIPEIRYMGKKQMPNGKELDYYRVVYRGILYTGWVYCPSCWRKLWQNTVMDSGWVDQETICRSCNTFIGFSFVTKSQFRVY